MSARSPMRGQPTAAVITVAVIHTNLLVNAGLRRIIEHQQDFRVIAECGDVRMAVEIVRSRGPRILIMGLHDVESISMLSLLRCASPNTLIALVADGAMDDHIPAQLVAAGAVAIIDQPQKAEVLINALRLIADGRTIVLPVALRSSIVSVLENSAVLDQASISAVDRLSERETEILGYLALGFSNVKIAQTLMLSEHTVKSHIKRVMQKLGCNNRGEAALTAFRSGLVQ